MTEELYDQAVQMVIKSQTVSTAKLQMRFKIKYSLAASLIERMVDGGIISEIKSNGARDVRIQKTGAIYVKICPSRPATQKFISGDR